jgi:hypothetical protein
MSGSLKNGLTMRSVTQRVKVEQRRFPWKDRLIENSSYLKLVTYSSTLPKIVHGFKISCAHEQKSVNR